MRDEGAMGGGFQGNRGYGQQPQAGYGGGYGGPPSGYGGGAYGPGGGADAGPGGGGSDVFPCAKNHVGRVIGHRGVTINDLQKRSGCDIQVNQNVPQGQDCQITLRGSREGMDMAKRMLQEILDMGANHPYAGGHGQMGGGQPGGDQGYQQPAYQTGYANHGQQSHMHAQQPYGMPQQQPQYGLQPAYPHGMQPGAPQAQPSPWKAATAADGQVYYYNQITQETQWDRPAGMQ